MNSIRWNLIESVTIHKLRDRPGRRGGIFTFHLKDIPNDTYALHEGVCAIQALMLLTTHSSIAEWGKAEEQNQVWIFQNWWTDKRSVSLVHKYMGDKEIAQILSLVRLQAQYWGWEITEEK